MQSSHSPNYVDHNRIARASVLNGVPIPALTVDILTARGVNVGELEARLRDSIGHRS